MSHNSQKIPKIVENTHQNPKLWACIDRWRADYAQPDRNAKYFRNGCDSILLLRPNTFSTPSGISPKFWRKKVSLNWIFIKILAKVSLKSLITFKSILKRVSFNRLSRAPLATSSVTEFRWNSDRSLLMHRGSEHIPKKVVTLGCGLNFLNFNSRVEVTWDFRFLYKNRPRPVLSVIWRFSWRLWHFARVLGTQHQTHLQVKFNLKNRTDAELNFKLKIHLDRFPSRWRSHCSWCSI